MKAILIVLALILIVLAQQPSQEIPANDIEGKQAPAHPPQGSRRQSNEEESVSRPPPPPRDINQK